MTENVFEEVHGFESLDHFAGFTRKIEQLVLDGELRPTPVAKVYASEMFEETWYETLSGELWRLVSPEYPFKGVFERVAKP